MRFELSSVDRWYTKELADRMEFLGFRFEKGKTAPYPGIDMHKVAEGQPVEIATLEELVKFIDNWGDVLVFRRDGKPCIQLADD